MEEKACLKATVSGLVQGVFFRAFVERHAISLKLKGYVKNLPAGDMEVLAEGEKSLLEKLLSLLHQGPRGARVEKVQVYWEEYKGDFNNFSIRY